MTKNSSISLAAKAFATKWAGQGYEKGQTQKFWMELLEKVLGVDDPFSFIEFEGQVRNLSSTSFMDAYIASTKVLIEQKSSKRDLSEPIRQSDGTMLTPFQQAKKYIVDMPLSKHPRWVVTCNFQEFCIYDMEKPLGDPVTVYLADLEKDIHRLEFLVDEKKEVRKKEVEVSMEAGQIIGTIYDALQKEYKNSDDPQTLRSLNILCVRLVFCLYAEDAGLFETRSQFHDYLVQFKPGTGDMRRALLDLFDVLNTPVEKRDPYLRDDLLAFPYVNGGLFADTDIEVPRFNQAIADLLLKQASDDFDWSAISPTIFGGVFESTLNPETRRKGGMHYTSIENIHKVIDPLFLYDLKKELADIKKEPSEKKRITLTKAFQDKIAGLKFLDPACGSGNFLTETFLSLRRLENECIRIINKGQMLIGDFVNPVKVSINQFYGIEINDFAVSVAMTALWIAEAQMLQETEKIMQVNLDFLPLKAYSNIREGNALRMDWNELIPASELNYIMGNPPFIGYSMQSESQKADMLSILVDEKGKPYKTAGKVDYVSAWYFKAAAMMQDNPTIKAALVSTNSITQGEQVASIWEPLMNRFGVHIDFAYRTFRWDSEASLKAHVHCVIIGFSITKDLGEKKLFDGIHIRQVEQINPYLVAAAPVFICSRTKPLCNVPDMRNGNRPLDGGNLIIEEDEYDDFIQREPKAKKYIKRFMMGHEFINNKNRWCLWLINASPKEISSMPLVMQRIRKVKEMREKSTFDQTRELATSPYRFRETLNPDRYIAIPKVSSEQRQYIPMGYLDASVIPGDKLFIIENASLYHFGVLTSNVHMAWMRAVAGRLEMRYSYSNTIVYNNFPWPDFSSEQMNRIERNAQAIIDTRAMYSDSSLANLYDDLTMPIELRKAHRANDAAVMEAYGFRKDMTEPEIVAELFKMYQDLTK